MITVMIAVFVLGYLGIALENKLKIDKTAIALLLGMILWTIYAFSGTDTIINANKNEFHEYLNSSPSVTALSQSQQATDYIVNFQLVEHLGNIAEILFYLLGAMTIVEAIDLHRGFNLITNRITTRNKRKLLWIIALITFFMSSVLDNLTTAIVMTMLLRKLITVQKERWIFGSIIIIAANAGGAWTPIGDVTTIMLWIHANITTTAIIQHLFLPSVISLLIPLIILSAYLKGKTSITENQGAANIVSGISNKESVHILIIGILCLISVPVFKSITNLPPFTGIMIALGVLWIYLEVLYNRKPNIPNPYRIPTILSKIDLSTILFFLGILLAVGALEAIGVLSSVSTILNEQIHNVYIINIIIGFVSSIIDNVPLVAAAMGMYPVVSPESLQAMNDAAYMSGFVQNGSFWQLLAYSAGTGGSILIIGSAAGVVVMGLEKISFNWYMKYITLPAIAGYLGGIGLYYVLTP